MLNHVQSPNCHRGGCTSWLFKLILINFSMHFYHVYECMHSKGYMK